jgi:hypothetical protein
MLIRLKKDPKAPVLTCIRDDGSVTYAKMPYGGFFPRHDLMHYAVETILALRESFFGLVAAGWSLEAFSESGVAKRLPLEARQTEFLVDQLEREHRFGECSTAEGFNAIIAASLAAADASSLRPILQKDLDAIRSRFEELLARYAALPDGKLLELKWKTRVIE